MEIINSESIVIRSSSMDSGVQSIPYDRRDLQGFYPAKRGIDTAAPPYDYMSARPHDCQPMLYPSPKLRIPHKASAAKA
ncbi:MAG: hypothetical protein GYA41_05530 [Bacteroidales bacterium]|nr:hypothetical protein [Bacteroidales bacterium]